MAESFVKTFKRDYVRCNPTPDAATVLAQLRAWFTDYNFVHPHSALKYRSPEEFRQDQLSHSPCPGFIGSTPLSTWCTLIRYSSQITCSFFH